MMAGEHPSESTLLEYVEDELDATSHAEVEAHLGECTACAADVKLARAGRDTARKTPLLEPPARLSERVLGEIAPRPSPRVAAGGRWLRLVAPVAAALTIAGGIATVAVLNPGGGGDDGDEGAAVAEEAAGDAGGSEFAPSAGETTRREEALSGTEPFSRIAADPQEVVQELRSKGFVATLRASSVVVRTKRLDALRRALRDYPSGSLAVRVE
jgi:Putative zinc-finger